MASITAFSNSGEEVIRRKLESCSIKRRAKTKEEIISYYEIDRCVEFAKKYETVSYLHITHTQTWSRYYLVFSWCVWVYCACS